jgi:hypothetical protein
VALALISSKSLPFNMHQPQTARDKVLWVLTFSDDPMDRNSLHTRTRLKISELKDILNSLAREGRVRQSREDPPMVSIRQSREQFSCAAKKRKRSKK